MVLLLNGRQGNPKEKQLDPVDYQVLQQMLTEDLSWMSDDTLKLLAVLYRHGSVLCGGIVDYRTALIVRTLWRTIWANLSGNREHIRNGSDY